MKICVRCIVKGRVQGVFFRASTQQQAERLNIQGSATNLTNGAVEVIACGEEENVKQLQQWLHQGPSAAQVDSVECSLHDSCECPIEFTTQ